MTLIQNEDNKCPTTKQVNDALEYMGGVQTLVLTTTDLVNANRSSTLKVNSADAAVMEVVKSNMTKVISFQLLYCGLTGMSPTCVPVSIIGVPSANMFTLYVNVSSNVARHFSLNKTPSGNWTASILSST